MITSNQLTFKQINSVTLPRNDDSNGTTTAIILEKISGDLLDDIYMEPTGMAEDARVMPMVHSFSSLLQQDPAPAAARGYSIEAATGVLSMLTNLGCSDESSSSARGGSDSCLVPSTLKEGAPWEIHLDPTYLLESFPFLP